MEVKTTSVSVKGNLLSLQERQVFSGHNVEFAFTEIYLFSFLILIFETLVTGLRSGPVPYKDLNIVQNNTDFNDRGLLYLNQYSLVLKWILYKLGKTVNLCDFPK